MKDSNTLPDIQLTRDSRGIALQKVGVSSVTMPIFVAQKNCGTQQVSATSSMSVHLDEALKGTHMSRFIQNMSGWSKREDTPFNLLDFLEETASELQADVAQARLEFIYSIDKEAPVSKLAAPMGYNVAIAGSLDVTHRPHVFNSTLEVTVPVATLCPCSKAISEYGAHNQRTDVRVKVNTDTAPFSQTVWIEDIIQTIDECSSCPVYPLLKRADEKYVTERQYENPKFVEDVARESILALREFPGVTGFSLEVESLESIHGHNAFTAHAENFIEI